MEKMRCNAWRPDPRLRMITLESPQFHQMWTSTDRTVHLKDLEAQKRKEMPSTRFSTSNTPILYILVPLPVVGSLRGGLAQGIWGFIKGDQNNDTAISSGPGTHLIPGKHRPILFHRALVVGRHVKPTPKVPWLRPCQTIYE